MTFHYRLHGLALTADWPLPELRPAEPGSGIAVRLGPVAPVPTRPDGYAIAADVIYFINPAVARYRITEEAITVDPARNAADSDVKLFLLGSALAALLHRRGMLPLHANTAVLGGRAIAFAGPSGAGKSTLAAALAMRGAAVLADDVSVLAWEAGRPMAQPGVARARLTGEAIRGLALDGEFPVATPGKLAVPLGEAAAAPLSRLYLLRPPGTPPRQLGGAEAMAAIVANTYRGMLVPLLASSEPHWRQCVTLARAIEVAELPRPPDFAALSRMADALVRALS